MSGSHEAKRTGRKERTARPAALSRSFFPMALLLALAIPLLPACSSTRNGLATRKAPNPATEPDPLKGNFDGKVADAGAATQSKSVPPVPEFQPTMSTAALASQIPGSKQPQDSHEQPHTDLPAGNWDAPGGVLPTSTSPKVVPVPVLGNPKPAALPEAGSVGPTSSGPPTNKNVAASQIAVTSGDASAQFELELKKRGARWQKEDIVGGVRLTCVVPSPQNAKAEWVIQTEAPDLVTAMQEALVRIDSSAH